MRVGLIGLGRWGTKILRALSPLCDVVPCPTHVETDAMLSDSGIDAVVIATPVGTHYALAERALLAGKHVFVEKPMCVFTSAAEQLVRLAAIQEKILFVGHIYVYHPSFVQLSSFVGANEIEKIHCNWQKFGTFDSDIVANLVSHDISLALALCRAEPTEFKLLISKGVVSAVDVIRLYARFGTTQCFIDIDRHSHEQKLKTVAVTLKNRRYHMFDFTSTDEALGPEMRTFLDACRWGRTPIITSGHHGLKVVRAVQTLRESIL